MKRTRRRAGGVLLALALMMGVMIPGGVSAAHAIEGGDANPTQIPWVAKLRILLPGNQEGSCTGSLISATWVLTAGHCLPRDTLGVDVDIRRDATSSSLRATTGIRWMRTDQTDVGLIELVHPIDGVSTANGTLARISALGDTSDATIYGAGKTSLDGKPSSQTPWPQVKSALQKLDGDGLNIAVFSGWEGLSNGYYRGLFLNRVIKTQSSVGRTLPGDSGGPLVQNGAVIGVVSSPGVKAALQFRLGISATHGETSVSSIGPAYDWILNQTGLAAADISADYPTQTIPGIEIRTDQSWLVPAKQADGTVAAQLVKAPFTKLIHSLLVDSTGAFQIQNEDGACLSLNAQPSVTAAGRNTFSNRTVFTTCDYRDPKQKFTLRNREAVTEHLAKFTIAQSTTTLSLGVSGSDVQVTAGTDTGDKFVLQSESISSMNDVAVLATRRPVPPPRAKRDSDARSVAMTFPSGATASVPVLANGVVPVEVQTSMQGGTSFIYALGDDGRLYSSTSQGQSGTPYKPWQQSPQPQIRLFAVSAGSGGAISSDGTNVYATYGGRFADLPSGTNVAQIAAVDGEGAADVYVLGSTGILYRSVDGKWTVVDRGVEALVPSETERAVAYTVAGRVMYFSPTKNAGRSVTLPALPNAAGISDLRLSAQGNDMFAYVLGLDGRVYKSAARGGAAFTAWERRPGENIVGLRTSTVDGGAVYTDGTTVYPSFADAALPALPTGTTVAGVAMGSDAGGKGRVYALSDTGDLFRLQLEKGGWTKINDGSRRVDRVSVSQTDGTAIFTTAARSTSP